MSAVDASASGQEIVGERTIERPVARDRGITDDAGQRRMRSQVQVPAVVEIPEAGVDPVARVVIRTSVEGEDPAWDAFLAATPGGHHTQTSLWAQVKASMGWDAARVVAEVDGRIVGGAQVLYRRLAPFVALGYLHHGPVLAAGAGADRLGALIMDHVEEIGRALHVRHITVQPPGRTDATPAFLRGRGYLPTEIEIAPRATVLIDVARSPEVILDGMHRKMRYNIRLSARRSVVVRPGGRADLDVYYRMLLATASRQGFDPHPRAYFERMWDVLSPLGHLRLSIAERDGAPLAGQIAIAFGDTVVNKLGVWSGIEGSSHPNEALHWSAISWAHAAGYRKYDVEGIKLKTARSWLNDALSEAERASVAGFKLRFGGEVVLMPPAQVHVPNPVGRRVFGHLYPRVSETQRVKSLVKALRTTSFVPERKR